jgi:excisionase family DNA binding protein
MPTQSQRGHPAHDPPDLIRVSQAAWMLGMSGQTVRDWYHARRIKGVRIGHQFRLYRTRPVEVAWGWLPPVFGAYRGWLAQVSGSSEVRSVGWQLIRVSTSVRYAHGFRLCCLALAQRLSSTLAVGRPASPPMNNQFLRPTANGRTARSATLLSMPNRASARYLFREAHWLRAYVNAWPRGLLGNARRSSRSIHSPNSVSTGPARLHRSDKSLSSTRCRSTAYRVCTAPQKLGAGESGNILMIWRHHHGEATQILSRV